MAFTHEHLEVLRLIHPGPIALAAIEAKPRARYFNLSDLPHLKVCAWCNARPITPPRRRYCGEDCQESATLYCAPQTPAMKMFVLIQLQDCTCVGCGECFDEELKKMVEQKWHVIKERHNAWLDWKKVPLHYLGDNTGQLWHVDHIIPIFRGGRGVCLENIQVLCVRCHQKKTTRERRTP